MIRWKLYQKIRNCNNQWNARENNPSKPQWQKRNAKIFWWVHQRTLNNWKKKWISKQVNRQKLPKLKHLKKKKVWGEVRWETRTGHLRTGINIKWYNMCEIETPEVEDTGQGREYQSGWMSKKIDKHINKRTNQT